MWLAQNIFMARNIVINIFFSKNQNFRQTPIATVQTLGSSLVYFHVQDLFIKQM